MVNIQFVLGASFLYIVLLFAVAYYADRKNQEGKSIISNPYIYSLSIAVYCTSWTFYGSVGKAATSGLDFILVYLGPSLTAFSWWFVLRRMVRITKENNITSIADFISLRYGKSQLLGAMITIISILGIMPYIALQLKAVSETFYRICGCSGTPTSFIVNSMVPAIPTGFFSALILSLFGVIFGARHLASSERHEGLVAAIAVESIVKLFAFLVAGVFIVYYMNDGFGDIFSRMQSHTEYYDRLTTIGEENEIPYSGWFTMLFLSMGAIMFLPRQFHIMVIENSNEEHIKKAMWLFPAYLLLINIFVIPIAFAGILYTGGTKGADYFVLSLPLASGHYWLALLIFLGGFSAAAGMVIVESVAISTMFLNHLVMPFIVALKPRDSFPRLLINLKRLGIFIVVFLGYFYHRIVGESSMLVNMGLISFAAAAQFGPALIGGLYWRRGNKAGALTGILFGFVIWFYTLLVPSIIRAGWWQSTLISDGPFGITFLKPTELFGLTNFDILSHSMFWSIFFNLGAYLALSIILPQDEKEKDQVKKFVDVFTPQREWASWETKRLSKPITITQFINLMSKFIGEAQAREAISQYKGNRKLDESGSVPEFELPKLKRFIEKTLAGSVGAAAAGAIVESYLSDIGSKMESVYDIFSTVRTSLAESREALSVRLRASEIMNRTLDLQIIMDDLLELLLKEFSQLDIAIIRIINNKGMLIIRSYRGVPSRSLVGGNRYPDQTTYLGESFLANKIRFINDHDQIAKTMTKEIINQEGILSFAHIPIAREGESPAGVLSVFSKSIVGLFTEPFLKLLSSLAGQLAQAVRIVSEMEEKERERRDKEKALLENARVAREMEIAKQIQQSLLPLAPPLLKGVELAGHCVSAAHVGGDYFDYFLHNDNILDMIIADVSGHSVGAALIMAETRSVLRAEAHSSRSAPDMLNTLNTRLFDDLSRAELFITMFYVKFDTRNHELTYASAGHNHPILFKSSLNSCMELDAEGLILGIKQEVDFEEKRITLMEGDILLLYTDGITEAQNQTEEFFGIGRLCEILETGRNLPAEEIIIDIQKNVIEFTGSATLNDDISMVILKVL